MTALPDHSDFVASHHVTSTDVVIRPNVRDHFWGYEVIPNDHLINVATVFRGACGVIAVASTVAAVGLWVMPTGLFAGAALAVKFATSLLLIFAAVLAARVTLRGTQIRVQVDTANGELREVVDGGFGTVDTLASYGLDAVESVHIVPSRSKPSHGQIQMHVNGVGKIAVGEGAILTLRPLRDRLARDCNVKEHSAGRVAVWGGPLAA